ncbi:MAG: tetratricopeptide repeat protein, partial [Nitrososphaeraceae archaeon]
MFSLLGEILVGMLKDIDTVPAKYLNNKGIRAYHVRHTLRLAADIGLIFDQEHQGTFYLAVAGGPIKVGELVSGGIEMLWRMGVSLMDLKEHSHAITYFDKIIGNTNDPNYLKNAWINKGVCFRRMNKSMEAIPCFQKALEIDGNNPIAITNLSNCLDQAQGADMKK